MQNFRRDPNMPKIYREFDLKNNKNISAPPLRNPV